MRAAANPAEIALRAGPEALFDLLAKRLSDAVGYELLTILAADGDGSRLSRPYSTRPDQFPCGAADPVEDTRWFRRLFVEQEPVIANDAASIREWLPAFADSGSSGYGSLLNVPIVVAGKVIGLINIMSGCDHFDDRRIEAVRNETPLAALAVLALAANLPTPSFWRGGADDELAMPEGSAKQDPKNGWTDKKRAAQP